MQIGIQRMITGHSFGLTSLLMTLFATMASAEVWTYDFPGGESFSSPDYEVVIESNGIKTESFVHYSYGLDEYFKKSEGIKNFKNRRGTESHSTAIFSFAGPITVHVTVKPNARHISLPLKSAKILPSSYDIPCRIVNGDTIVFPLDRPEKVAVMANYEQAWNVFAGLGTDHVAIQNWDSNYAAESETPTFRGENLISKLSESYKNPLFIIALPPEGNVPDKHSSNTLLIEPGEMPTQDQIYKYDVLWFTAGVHDWSEMPNTAYPWRQIGIGSGQTVYLEGGSYVYAHFRKNGSIGTGKSSILGRGMLSGLKHEWAGGFVGGSMAVDFDSIIGVSFTDRNCFSIYGGSLIKDVSLLGAWHGNCDGPDHTDNCLIENCFFLSHDDNLKLNNNTHARHIVLWQMPNAHSIMVKEIRNDVTFRNCVVEDVDIIGYFPPGESSTAWSRISKGAISCVLGSDMRVEKFTFRNIRIESPFLYRVFSLYNLDTQKPYTAKWFTFRTTEDRHSRVEGLSFENISVRSPLILYRSLIGSAYEGSMSDIIFSNVTINDTVISEENRNEYFEIESQNVKNIRFD
jgi:hypothetical protein